MLIEFTVGNFCSFRSPVTLSLVAARLTSRDRLLDENNRFEIANNPALLTSAAVFGPNASGKSNLVSAVAFMRMFILTSAEGTERVGGIHVEPFRLNRTAEQQASHFETVFIIEGTRYRYGFEVTCERVTSEWLYMASKRVEAMLFDRDADNIKLGVSFKEGRRLAERTRPNALFLSVAAQWDGPIAQKVVKWFRRIGLTLGVSSLGMHLYTAQQLLDGGDAARIIDFVKQLDLGIADIKVDRRSEIEEPVFPSNMPEEIRHALRTLATHRDMQSLTVKTVHKVYDDEGHETSEVEFDLDDSESAGTSRLFALSAPIVEALKSGRLMVIDELDARLHHKLTRGIVELFNSPETNPNHAQLIFTTHDVNLLDNSLFRRDQLWFIEKDSKGESQLYSLAEFKGIRNDLSLERNYLLGSFGAVPYVDGLSTFVKESQAAYGAQTE